MNCIKEDSLSCLNRKKRFRLLFKNGRKTLSFYVFTQMRFYIQVKNKFYNHAIDENEVSDHGYGNEISF